jgi:hypothetical protein
LNFGLCISAQSWCVLFMLKKNLDVLVKKRSKSELQD